DVSTLTLGTSLGTRHHATSGTTAGAPGLRARHRTPASAVIVRTSVGPPRTCITWDTRWTLTAGSTSHPASAAARSIETQATYIGQGFQVWRSWCHRRTPASRSFGS